MQEISKKKTFGGRETTFFFKMEESPTKYGRLERFELLHTSLN